MWRYNENEKEKEEKGWVYLSARSSKNAGDVHVHWYTDILKARHEMGRGSLILAQSKTGS
jgi:hypothetical protein